MKRISGPHRALFTSFLGDLVREHVGVRILSWKKVNSEARDKMWDEITRYFDVDLTARRMLMTRLGKLLRNFRRKLAQNYILPNLETPSKLTEAPANYKAIIKADDWVNFVNYTQSDEFKVKSAATKEARSMSLYQHRMGRGGYAGVIDQMVKRKEIEPDEEPPRTVMWLTGRQNKDGEFYDDDTRAVGEKIKETEDKIKQGTLKVDHGSDAMTVVLGKEKGGYARGVGGGVTYRRYFDLPRNKQASDERVVLLQTELENERRQSQEKESLIQDLMKQLAAQKGQSNSTSTPLASTPLTSTPVATTPLTSTQLTPSEVSPVNIKQINSSAVLQVSPDNINATTIIAEADAGTRVSGCEEVASMQKSNGLSALEKEKETSVTVKPAVASKKTARPKQKDARQSSQSQDDESSLQELPQVVNCKLWHSKRTTIIALGKVYKSDGKQMIHNRPLPKNCYKVSVDKSLQDAACIPEIGGNGFKTVKEVCGGFVAWPKEKVILEDQLTPPSTIQLISEHNKGPPKLTGKRTYVSLDAMKSEAAAQNAQKKKTQKTLNYVN